MENMRRRCNSRSEDDRRRPCETEDNFKSNCDEDLSEELRIGGSSISNARCVGIVAEKIFDAVSLQEVQFADKEEVFTIDNFDPDDSRSGRNGRGYRVGAPVCIDDISLCYDFVGMKDDDDVDDMNIGAGNIMISYDSNEQVFAAVPGNARSVCNFDNTSTGESESSSSCDEDDTVNLYDEFESRVARNKCNAESNGIATRQSRVFKQGVRFFVDNLKVKIRGRIGDRPFTATKDYSNFGDVLGRGQTFGVNPVEITARDTFGNGEGCGDDVGLNFVPVNLYGKVGTPSDRRTVTSNVSYEPCLSAECIETTETYGESGEGYIRATVEYSFLTNQNIRHTTTEQLAVFTNPNGVESRDATRESDCERDNDNDDSNPCRMRKCRNRR